MVVYRIEHPDTGCGPYNSGEAEDEIVSRMWYKHSTDKEHPGTLSEGFYGLMCAYPDECIFGCISLEHLLLWFKGYFRHLIDNLGYVVVEIEVPSHDVKIGKVTKYQVAFSRKHIISEKTIDEEQLKIYDL